MKELLKNLNTNKHAPYSLIRIFLGGALIIRGFIIAANPEEIIELVRNEQLHMWFSYATIAHIIGGISLMLGLYTRIGTLIQIPILFGAVFMVHAKNGFMMAGQSLEISALVLFLLCIFLVFGSGAYSIDSIIASRESSEQSNSVATA